MFVRELKFQLSTIPSEYKTLFSIKAAFSHLISNAGRKPVQILGRDINVSLKLGIGFSVLFLMVVFLYVDFSLLVDIFTKFFHLFTNRKLLKMYTVHMRNQKLAKSEKYTKIQYLLTEEINSCVKSEWQCKAYWKDFKLNLL